MATTVFVLTSNHGATITYAHDPRQFQDIKYAAFSINTPGEFLTFEISSNAQTKAVIRVIHVIYNFEL